MLFFALKTTLKLFRNPLKVIVLRQNSKISFSLFSRLSETLIQFRNLLNALSIQLRKKFAFT
jgi:hypothetical protein